MHLTHQSVKTTYFDILMWLEGIFCTCIRGFLVFQQNCPHRTVTRITYFYAIIHKMRELVRYS